MPMGKLAANSFLIVVDDILQRLKSL